MMESGHDNTKYQWMEVKMKTDTSVDADRNIHTGMETTIDLAIFVLGILAGGVCFLKGQQQLYVFFLIGGFSFTLLNTLKRSILLLMGITFGVMMMLAFSYIAPGIQFDGIDWPSVPGFLLKTLANPIAFFAGGSGAWLVNKLGHHEGPFRS